jgi:hypothetical protein
LQLECQRHAAAAVAPALAAQQLAHVLPLLRLLVLLLRLRLLLLLLLLLLLALLLASWQ